MAICLKTTGGTASSTGERIAAAYLPSYYDDMVEAWARLGEEWQGYVRIIKQHYMHLIKAE